MRETFREFFEKRNRVPFPAIPGGVERTDDVMKRLAETLADWADELARPISDPEKGTP